MLKKLLTFKLVVALSALLLAPVFTACSPAHVHVFSARPQLPMKVMGMLNGSGPNEASAMENLIEQAQKMEANGVVIIERKMIGRLFVIRAEVIRYRGKLPPQQR
jgi:hypothetical protein